MGFTSRIRVPMRRIYRGSFCALLLLGQVAATFGYPAVALHRQNVGNPFPCQDRPCGCSEAEKSSASCCCAKPAKRSCCDDRSNKSCETKAAPQGIRWVPGISAQKCRGEAPSGLLAAEPAVLPPASGDAFSIEPNGEISAFLAGSEPILTSGPPFPPPRLR